MKLLSLLFISTTFLLAAYPQNSSDVLATATNLTFTTASFSTDGQKLFNNQKTAAANARLDILSQMLTDTLLKAEAKSKNLSVEVLIEAEMKKLPVPSAAEIKAVYDANRAAFGNKTLDAARPEIINYLHHQAEQRSLQTLVEGLRARHKLILGKDVNAVALKPMESVASVNGKSISAQEFEEKNKIELYEIRARIADEIMDELENSIFTKLIDEEAKSRNIGVGELYAAEITNKMRDYSDEEKAGLQIALKKMLFAKFKVKIFLKEIEPFVQNISADDDPSQGKAAAPVTVVMFTDFQCPACAATHPVLKKIIGEYGDKIRLVVRDFPLTSIHENAFTAALAANAANVQGKFFEYTDILYQNQNALDTASLKKYAVGLGLNVRQFEIDLSSEKAAAEVRKDMADGKLYGIGGTPAIFVNGIKVRRLSAESIRNAVDKALKK
ncbi:MAG: thioredoxin domain-containing protein [Pyrinomonadaceae bacterium]